MTHLNALIDILTRTSPYWGLLLGAFALSLFLTPLVREMNRRLGMVDMPSARRINRTPIPRGGGLAVILAFGIATTVFVACSDKPISA